MTLSDIDARSAAVGVAVGLALALGGLQWIPGVRVQSAEHDAAEQRLAACEAVFAQCEESRSMAWRKYGECREGADP